METTAPQEEASFLPKRRTILAMKGMNRNMGIMDTIAIRPEIRAFLK